MPKGSVPKYDDVFSVLEYLSEKGALVLEFNIKESAYTIRNQHYVETK